MGIRVHKQMGYGLCDLLHDEKGYRCTDPRINVEGKLFADRWDLEVEDYLAWLDARHDDELGPNFDKWVLRDLKLDKDKPRMSDTLAWQGEFGLPNVLVLTPLAMREWRRFDDAIDYAVETYLFEEDKAQTNRVDLLGHGIYPWNALFMDARTGERLDQDKAMTWVRLHWPSVPEVERTQVLDILARSMGFADRAEAEKEIAPLVPQEIRDIAEYGELFTDEMVWTQLRPMLYTYWS